MRCNIKKCVKIIVTIIFMVFIVFIAEESIRLKYVDNSQEKEESNTTPQNGI